MLKKLVSFFRSELGTNSLYSKHVNNQNMAVDGDAESIWTVDLESALLDECSFNTIREICQGRSVPKHLRAEVWQICLGVMGKEEPVFDEFFDLPEQTQIRENCHDLVEKLGNEEEEIVSITSDLESILTLYSKSKSLKFESNNGWTEALQPLLALKLNRSELYNVFYALNNKFVPRECYRNGRPFHLFRLLLLYHDPELCSFLDTKKITPDLYALPWFRSIFANVCNLQVISAMWDIYFQQSDQFLVFFLALVILVNAKEQIFSLEMETKSEIIDQITKLPSELEAEDISDFMALASYYSSRTPQSFRRDYQRPLFSHSLQPHKAEAGDAEMRAAVSQALCLPVSVAELLSSAYSQQIPETAELEEENVRYFIIDCRPAEQYNSGHLPTAFHLDANLMLQNQTEFAMAVTALTATQKTALASGAVAGGDHLCFMGSGREEEDQYVHMVIANFLQKNYKYVCMARGGYEALHQTLLATKSPSASLADQLVDHYPKQCICCNPVSEHLADGQHEQELDNEFDFTNKAGHLIGKFRSMVKSRSANVKEKLTNYIKNEPQPSVERHVSGSDKVGKRYRNTTSVFSIGDDDDHSDTPVSDDDAREIVSLDLWTNKPDVKHVFGCKEVRENGFMYPSFILVTDSHLFVLREIEERPGMARIQVRRALGSVVKITSKKRHPELISFKYGTNSEASGLIIADTDRFLIPRAGEATKIIKHQIMKVLDSLNS